MGYTQGNHLAVSAYGSEAYLASALELTIADKAGDQNTSVVLVDVNMYFKWVYEYGYMTITLTGSDIANTTVVAGVAVHPESTADYPEIHSYANRSGWLNGGKFTYEFQKTSASQIKTFTVSMYNTGVNATSVVELSITIPPRPEATAIATANEGGTATVDGESSVTVQTGSTVTYEATANEHYSFNGWYNENDELVSSNNPYSFALTNDTTLVAKFLGDAFLINTSSGNYIASTSGGGTYRYNTQCTLSAIVTSDITQYHYSFDGWYLNGVKVSSDREYTFTVLGGGIYEARGTRTLQEYEVNLTAGDYISSVSGDGTYEYGQNCEISAIIPSPTTEYEYTFDGWYNENNEKISSNVSYVFVVHGPVTLTAKAIRGPRKYLVTVLSLGDGTGYVNGMTQAYVEYNTSCELTAVPESWASFIKWNDDDIDNPRTISSVTTNMSFTAIFTEGARTQIKTGANTWSESKESYYKSTVSAWKKILKIFKKTSSSTWSQTL